MKRLIAYLFPTVAILVALIGPRDAYALSFRIGESLNHNLSVCLKKEDAIEILDVDQKDGFAASSLVWDKKDECLTLPVTGVKVGKVVYTANVKRNDKSVIAKVVELVHDGKVVAYFLTTAPVSAIQPLGQAGSDKEV